MIKLKTEINIQLSKKINEEINTELEKLLNLYKNKYSSINSHDKKEYFETENKIRLNIENESEGYMIKNKKLIVEDRLISFIYLRQSGLKKCIKNQEYFLKCRNIKDNPNEYIYLIFYIKELYKIQKIINEYEQYKNNYLCNNKQKIEFIKNIYKNINWGFEDKYKCDILCDNKHKYKLHIQTKNNNKQHIFGDNNSDWAKLIHCNSHFYGPKASGYQNKANYNNVFKICDKSVEFNVFLNRYATMSSFYLDAPFIKFYLPKNLVSPYRRFPATDDSFLADKIKVGSLQVGPFKLLLYYSEKSFINTFGDTNNIYIYQTKIEKSRISYVHIIPPLLRSSVTITYMEFKDLLCYLNLPVFRSTIHKDILFFPNYNLYQELLEIQELLEHTIKPIKWIWFENTIKGHDKLVKVINLCKKYEENINEQQKCEIKKKYNVDVYGIEPVNYEWYEIIFETGISKKYIFLVTTKHELNNYYNKSKFFYSITYNKYYLYNDQIKLHALNKINEQTNLNLITSKQLSIGKYIPPHLR